VLTDPSPPPRTHQYLLKCYLRNSQQFHTKSDGCTPRFLGRHSPHLLAHNPHVAQLSAERRSLTAHTTDQLCDTAVEHQNFIPDPLTAIPDSSFSLRIFFDASMHMSPKGGIKLTAAVPSFTVLSPPACVTRHGSLAEVTYTVRVRQVCRWRACYRLLSLGYKHSFRM
jgi:hypothetical protein